MAPGGAGGSCAAITPIAARRHRRSHLPQPDVRSRKVVGGPEIPATASASYCARFHDIAGPPRSPAAADDASMQVNATSAAVEPRPLVFAGLPATSWAFAIRIWIARPGGTAAADRSCGPAKAGRDQISRRAQPDRAIVARHFSRLRAPEKFHTNNWKNSTINNLRPAVASCVFAKSNRL